MPRAFICFPSSSDSQRGLASDPQFHVCPVFIRQYKGWRHWARCRIKILQNPKSLQRSAALSHSYELDRLAFYGSYQSQTLYGSTWALNFLWVHCPASPLEMFQQSLESPPTEASLHMLILYHQCNGPILLMWEENRDRAQVTIL